MNANFNSKLTIGTLADNHQQWFYVKDYRYRIKMYCKRNKLNELHQF